MLYPFLNCERLPLLFRFIDKNAPLGLASVIRGAGGEPASVVVRRRVLEGLEREVRARLKVRGSARAAGIVCKDGTAAGQTTSG